MTENLENQHWILKSTQMALNMRFSHPVIDSFFFKNSKKFAFTRKICVEFMLQQPSFLSHQEILLSMMFLSIEPDNNIPEALTLFANCDFVCITDAAIEMDHKDLPKTAAKEFDVDFMSGSDYKSMKAPPVEQIVKQYAEYDDSHEFYMKHFYFDMRKSFEMTLHQRRYLKEYNYLANFQNKDHEDEEEAEVTVYPMKSNKGFSSRSEYAKFLRRLPEEAGDNFEQYGLPIIMIEDMFEKTKWV